VSVEPGFETGLAWGERDSFSKQEAEALIRWYEESHGEGTVELTKFVPFLIENRPGALKRYRRYAQAIHELGDLPQVTIALLFLHYYALIGNERGVRYQVIAARKWGATQAEALDVLELAFLSGGPFAGNAAAEAVDLLADWPAGAPREVDDPWPAGWLPREPRASDTKIDVAPAGATAEEIAAIGRWLEAAGTPRPATVDLLGRYAPGVLKALYGRYEQAASGASLPQQLVPLLELHAAAIGGRFEVARRALGVARSRGVTRAQALAILAFVIMYSLPSAVEELAEQLGPELAEWS
jgi:alkylhydroperoxidase/carboxymuconolactone decarboxylase family protein YurZ